MALSVPDGKYWIMIEWNVFVYVCMCVRVRVRVRVCYKVSFVVRSSIRSGVQKTTTDDRWFWNEPGHGCST